MTVAGIIIISFTLLNKHKISSIQTIHYKYIILISFFHIYITYIFEYISLKHINSSKACLLYSVTPFITALLSYKVFREKLLIQQLFGLSIGILGILPIIFNTAQCNNSKYLIFNFISFPEIMLLCSVLSSSLGWITIKYLITNHKYSIISINGLSMFLGGILALCTSFFFEKTPKIYSTNHLHTLLIFFLYLFLLILISNIICYNLYAYLLKKFSATLLAFSGFSCPLFSALLGYLFLGEKISKEFFLSSFTLTLGIYIFYKKQY
jgi:drug/metabolite transporter (DMT)-like permease